MTDIEGQEPTPETDVGNGKAHRVASYKERKLREIYKRNYGSKMAQIETDLKQLESHTGL